MSIGNNLTAYRKRQGLTQQQLGEILNLSSQAISKWENDQAEPDLATIRKLAELYGVSLDALLSPDAAVTPIAVAPAENSASTETPPKKPSKLLSFLKKHKHMLLGSSLAVVGLALITTGTLLFLNLFVFNIFRIGKVEQIKLGMTEQEVIDILGEPCENNEGYAWKDSLAEITDGSVSTGGPTIGGFTYLYYEEECEELLIELGENLLEVNSLSSLDGLIELEEELLALTYKQIMISFDPDGKVNGVWFDPYHKFDYTNEFACESPKEVEATDILQAAQVLTVSGSRSTAIIEEAYFLRDTIITVTYTDGSYYTGTFFPASLVADANGYVKPDSSNCITFSGHTGLSELSLSLPITCHSDGHILYHWFDSSATEVHVPTSITRIESGAFQRCTDLQQLHLPSGTWVYSSNGQITELEITDPKKVAAFFTQNPKTALWIRMN